ncbi:hypothetical protein FC84_GL001377 [Lapidilactobacillus dextrinicus DSM 20335]|uniref:ABC-2 type transporter domain-containing protein n=1 Tax=Lapidilactobacillus dextrinicus DSM 20335 TaxID=1423738 RepID=A0A0R2BI64_9LACO|nr:hypothetical protein [Lapidilactobacillus dextrinicus]KRM79208.1 hypothetical protein FC84_GL001377 [Lapidilactobacillus dextrinicus DSM 20335]QFG46949.1 hypothetical protein LH506_05565 [Lapidilactobacillus dextrinicus]
MTKLSSILSMVKTELEMEAKTRYKYLASTLSDFVIFTLAYIAVLFFADVTVINQSYHTNDGTILILIGYMFWNVGVVAMDISTQTIESDSRAGILETEIQSRFPLWVLIMVRSWVTNLITFGYLLIISLITAIVIGQSVLSLLNAILLVMLLSSVSNLGMFGIGLIFGAGSLIFKSIGQWATLLQGIILIFANVAIPYTTWIQAILPFGLGIEIARSLYLQRDVEWITVLVYIVINVILLCIGLLIFNIALQHERKYGSFERF